MNDSPVVADASSLIALNQIAKKTGLPVIGTLGALRAAKRQGILSEIRPDVEKLLQFGFHRSPEVVDRVLADVGEGD